MSTCAVLGVAPLHRAWLTSCRSKRTHKRYGHSVSIVVRASADENDKSSSSSPGTNQLLSKLCPLLKVFSGGDAAAPRNRVAEVATSGFASIARLPFGVTVQPECATRSSNPKKPITLYEFEACPFCRRVRETATQLDLELIIKPCPKDSLVHREEALAKGNVKGTYPFLVDENTGMAMSESEDIARYLWSEYGENTEFPEAIVTTTIVTGWMPTLLRAGRGMTRYANTTDSKDSIDSKVHSTETTPHITLYNYEGNQFARLVREALCELELPYVLKNAGKGSGRRDELRKIDQDAAVPYLIDTKTGTQLGESEDIIAYLFQKYGGYGGGGGA